MNFVFHSSLHAVQLTFFYAFACIKTLALRIEHNKKSVKISVLHHKIAMTPYSLEPTNSQFFVQ